MKKLLVALSLFVTSTLVFASTESTVLEGRLVESICNTATGVAQITLLGKEKASKKLNYYQINLVNNKLCSKSIAGLGATLDNPLQQLVGSSVLGFNPSNGKISDSNVVSVSLNVNNIATKIEKIGKNLNVSLDEIANQKNYSSRDLRLLPLDFFNGDNEYEQNLAEKLIELADQ